MAFQRSYSKVWWGSDNITNSATFNFYEKIDNNRNDTNNNNNNNIEDVSCSGGDFYSLDSQHHIKYSGNLSRIQEVEENSKLWRSHDSPGSLKSQDSGFSDHDESSPKSNTSKFSTTSSSLSSSLLTPTKKVYDSPQSIETIETPPTVIKRKLNNTNLISPISLSNRISFSAPNSPNFEYKNINNNSNCDLINQIDRISFINSSTPNQNLNNINNNNNILFKFSSSSEDIKDRSIRRRRVSGNRKTKRNIFSKNFNENTTLDMSDKSLEFENYQNETIYLVGLVGENNNINNDLTNKSFNKLNFKTKNNNIPKIINNNFNGSFNLSDTDSNDNIHTLPYYYEYENPLLNGHSLPVQYWIDDTRKLYDHEVMSTLQTKSIAQEAFRNLKITTNAVAKIIRQLQIRSFELQTEFERCEKILCSNDNKITLQDAITNSIDLINKITEFVKIIERRSVFFTEYRVDRKKFEINIENIQIISKDLKISLENKHYLEFNFIYDDIQVIKNYILLTIRLVFEKLIKIIIKNIENSKCDLMLRANLNMIATLSNIDYIGFGSLTEAFINNETERILLLICLDNKLSSVRALTLRALATICSTTKSIQQFCLAGGIDIIKDILSSDIENNKKRNEPEKREAVSLLTQITAPWHGSEHKVIGFKDCIETIIEGITDLIVKTNCCQTLLLCAASLNNMSRLEMTSVYSIMSNETIIKLKEAVDRRGPGVSIFLYEQITTMLYNMSSNKKCHNHLANKIIINFITYIFQSQFYKKFQSRAESEAHRKTIKIILHIYQRLIHESLVGKEILENNFIPIFTKIEQDLIKNYEIYGNNGNCCEYSKDISYLTRQLNESISNKSFNRSIEGRNSVSKLNLTRQESYV